MAISAKSKILASDINTALSGKQDALGYIPVKSVNGVAADAAGNVSDVDSWYASTRIGWLRFTNGLQILWDSEMLPAEATTTITLAKSFKNAPIITTTQRKDFINVYDETTSSFKVTNSYSSELRVSFIAIGYWK